MKYVGIDLGTTYSCAYVIDDTSCGPQLCSSSTGDVTTPSVVNISDKGVSVGRAAKRRLRSRPEETVEMAKRYMGTDKVWTIRGKDYTPTQISSFILKEVFSNVKPEGEYRCVVTCPACYTLSQREYVKEAARMAGIRDPSILNEPTAAALSHGFYGDMPKANLVVFDLGGGTLDVTVIHYDRSENLYEVLASDGKPFLGGKDWDTAVADILYGTASDALGTTAEELRRDIEVVSAVESESERIKTELSSGDFSEDVYIRGVPIPMDITRADFEARTAGLMAEAVGFIGTTVETASRNLDQHSCMKGPLDIDGVVLVGGSCRMPGVKAAIEAAYPEYRGKVWSFEPDLAIAKGAALYASLQGECRMSAASDRLHMGEVLSTTFGMGILRNPDSEIDDIVCSNMLFKNDRIPARREKTFHIRPGESSVRILLYRNPATDRQSEDIVELDDCDVLLDKDMRLDFTAGDDEPIVAGFEIALDGILTVTLDCRGGSLHNVYEVTVKDYDRNLKHVC